MIMNLHTIVGRVGQDPEVKEFSNGGSVCNFSVATSDRWKDKDGNQQERTEWHRIACFNEHLTKVISQYVKKGSSVCITGKVQTRSWTDSDDNKRYSTETVIEKFSGSFEFVGSKADNESSGSDYQKEKSQPKPVDLNEELNDEIPWD
jgi:single-strand DNA-binding protein